MQKLKMVESISMAFQMGLTSSIKRFVVDGVYFHLIVALNWQL